MNSLEQKVREFMDRQDVTRAPCFGFYPRYEDRFARIRLILEEFAELMIAMHEEDLEEVADALGDLLYVVVGAFVLYGIPIDPIFDEIHASNMTKTRLGPTKKGGKTEGFRPPRIKEVLSRL